MTETIESSKSEGVLRLRFNRPGKRNALSQEMYRELARQFQVVGDDAEVKVVVLSGQPGCFTSGNDMKDFLSVPPDATESPTLDFMNALANCPKPVIAAPSGIAVGVGVTLLLHCDLVYCGAQTRLNMPFAQIGIRPEYASSYLLPRLMGHARAAEVLLLGEFSASKALEYGLVNAVVPNEQVEAVAMEKARVVAELPPATVRAIKAMLKHWRAGVVKEAIPWEMGEVARSLSMPEALESIGAFLQKRKPDFSGFS